jgi:general secretion pathway protein G
MAASRMMRPILSIVQTPTAKVLMTRHTTPEPSASPTASRRNDAGFTLLEILVVIVILGLLIGLVAPAVLRQLGGARVSIAHQSIARIGSVLDMYKLDVGSYPTTDQGLQALVQAPAGVSNWNGPYVQSGQVPVDPWSHPYVYRDPSDRAGHDYDLCSAGPSGDATGSDMICN